MCLTMDLQATEWSVGLQQQGDRAHDQQLHDPEMPRHRLNLAQTSAIYGRKGTCSLLSAPISGKVHTYH